MMKCLTPLIPLTDCDGRLAINLGTCTCSPTATELILIKAGCTEYDEVVEVGTCDHSFGCGCSCVPTVKIKQVERPKMSITYPLHEFDCDGNAVFVIDGKLKTLGYGRYNAIVQTDCGDVKFDVDYTCGTPSILGIMTEKVTNMGERC